VKLLCGVVVVVAAAVVGALKHKGWRLESDDETYGSNPVFIYKNGEQQTDLRRE
jgi:hypothetical protein